MKNQKELSRIEIFRLLLVDDSKDIRDCIKDDLKCIYADQIEIIECNSGNQAINVLNEMSVNMVVSDFEMNDGSGLVVHSKVKSLLSPPQFIFFSGSLELTVGSFSFKEFPVKVIFKPDIESLLMYIQNYIDSRKLKLKIAY